MQKIMIAILTTRITHLELGNLKVPSSHPSDPNPEFLPNLAFGTLWAFPNLINIKVFLSFSNTEQDLVDIVKQLKQGLPLVYREYEASTYPDPILRTLKSIQFHQCADFGLLRPSVWKYLAGSFGGGAPIDIVIYSDRMDKFVKY